MGRASELRTFILENFWNEVRSKMLFKIPSIRENVASFLSNIGKFNFKKFKKLYSSLLINSVAERRRVLGCDAVQAI
jgi:hypothetical protein